MTYWGKNGTGTRVIENILKPDGNRISAQVDYEYDDLYRLVHEHRIAYNGGDPGVAYEYNFTYDAAGNRTAWEVVGVGTTYYTYDAANKMLTAGDSTFAYDIKGNMLSETKGSIVTTYTWDYLNLLTRWQETNKTTGNYAYDGDGMRVRVTPQGGIATSFLLDIEETAEEISGASAISYIGSGWNLTSKVVGETRLIFHVDGIGSIRSISSANQTVSEVNVYDAYGNKSVIAGTGDGFDYAGRFRYYTDSTGLNHLKARYYAPAVGRFISRDPIGYSGGINLYRYADNNPVAVVDPSGTHSVKPRDPRFPKPPTRGWRPIVTNKCCIEDAVRNAYRIANRHFPGTRGELNGSEDAFRHCVWACLVRKTCGADAYNSGVIDHENDDAWWARGHWDPISSPMDLANDEVGRKCAGKGGTCENCCLDALHHGDLYILDPKYWSP
jgi:RHS repeat-associated protein